MKTNYTYLLRRISRHDGRIDYEVDLISNTKEMQMLTVFKAFPNDEGYRIIEEREENRFFYGLVSKEQVHPVLSGLAKKFRANHIQTKLEAMRGER
jgi:hypothetical protein